MKLGLVVLATLALSAPLAHASDPVGYFDVTKALNDGADAKRETEALKADQTRRQAEIDGIESDAKKLDAECAKAPKALGKSSACDTATAKHQRASELFNQYTRQGQQLTQVSQATTLARINRILPDIAKAKHLAALVPLGGVFYAAPGVDLTAEVLRRLDAGDGKEDRQAVTDANARAAKAEERARAAEAELARVRKLGLKATGIAKQAIDERDKAIHLADEAVSVGQRALNSGRSAELTDTVAPSPGAPRDEHAAKK